MATVMSKCDRLLAYLLACFLVAALYIMNRKVERLAGAGPDCSPEWAAQMEERMGALETETRWLNHATQAVWREAKDK